MQNLPILCRSQETSDSVGKLTRYAIIFLTL